ncbi:MAG: hypothetical protein KDA47_10620 [Planctomycetales bacterium]|nr:hypothetical protein [Planctomycetales bacterium]
MSHTNETPRATLSSRWRTGVACSCALHGGVLVLAFAVGTWIWLDAFNRPRREYLTAVYVDAESVEAIVERSEPEMRPVERVEDVTGDMVDSRLRDVIDEASRRDTGENLDELDRLAGRLDSMSNAESVSDTTAALRQMTGLSERATEPSAEPVAGEFDLDTAQLYDVRRADPPDERFPYRAVLLDSAGRTQEIPMTQSEGAPAFQTFERLKRFPLARQIYQQFTMSLLDSLLKSARDTKSAAKADDFETPPSDSPTP